MDVFGVNFPTVYCFGVLGSIGVELAAALTAASANDGLIPPKYKKPMFVGLRLVFAFIAGSVPYALDAQNAWSAIYLGASAPLVFDRAARGLDPADKKEAG
ncbi:hypothetical protein NKJ48_31080 [Mesorhizobium sp. M0114]|uniref:hypothetical protein n=1 Tax=unclassified Mesorhizobium TaxID=325217 RepID=UPI00333866B6